MSFLKKCPECGNSFVTEIPYKIFCCKEHSDRYYHNHGKEHDFNSTSPIIRSFECRECKKIVYVTDTTDKRYVYCSQKCEKEYWRKKTRRNYSKARSTNQGMSGGMSLGSLIRRERRDLL